MHFSNRLANQHLIALGGALAGLLGAMLSAPVVAIVHGDILDLDLTTVLDVIPEPLMPLWGVRLPYYHVVANLPYYITAAVLRHLLEAAVRPARMVITVQREVAARIGQPTAARAVAHGPRPRGQLLHGARALEHAERLAVQPRPVLPEEHRSG